MYQNSKLLRNLSTSFVLGVRRQRIGHGARRDRRGRNGRRGRRGGGARLRRLAPLLTLLDRVREDLFEGRRQRFRIAGAVHLEEKKTTHNRILFATLYLIYLLKYYIDLTMVELAMKYLLLKMISQIEPPPF